jgi:hypothetical protein
VASGNGEAAWARLGLRCFSSDRKGTYGGDGPWQSSWAVGSVRATMHGCGGEVGFGQFTLKFEHRGLLYMGILAPTHRQREVLSILSINGIKLVRSWPKSEREKILHDEHELRFIPVRV